jgi:hypothetical protein
MNKMLKKIGLSAIALIGMLAIAPHQANAAVRFGVRIGRPAYAYPVYPVYPTYPVYPAPAVVYGGWGRHDLRWDRRHDFRRR